MTRWEFLKRADVLLNTFNNVTNETHKQELDILRESVEILKRATERIIDDADRYDVQNRISQNLRKLIVLSHETGELMDSAIKLEAMVKELSNPPAQN